VLSRRSALTTLAGGLAWAFRPPSLAADDANGTWVKSPHNPMLSLGQPGEFDSQNLFGPAVAKQDGKYYLFYCGGPHGPKTGEDLVRYQLGLALSDDGTRWQKTGKPLLPLGERDNFHCTPTLLRGAEGHLAKRDGQWHLLYCGNRADDVEHATSMNGLQWETDGRNPIFRAAYAPNLVEVDGELRMYYVHKAGRSRPWEVWLATGPDFYSLKPHPANPMLTLSQPWEKDHVFYPYVLREEDTWVIFYASYWANYPQRKTATAIGMATSRDGLKWTKHGGNPVLTPTPGSSFDATYTSSEAVIRDGDHYKLYYGARIDQVHKYFAIGLATHSGRLVPEK
jgi:predicted GH43/DUF377 family glycosyl hydrolase